MPDEATPGAGLSTDALPTPTPSGNGHQPKAGLPPWLTPGNPGNSGGKKGRSGRIPQAIRLKLRKALNRNVKILEAILKDEKATNSEKIAAFNAMAKHALPVQVAQVDSDGDDLPPPGRLTPAEIQTYAAALAARVRPGA